MSYSGTLYIASEGILHTLEIAGYSVLVADEVHSALVKVMITVCHDLCNPSHFIHRNPKKFHRPLVRRNRYPSPLVCVKRRSLIRPQL